MAEALRSRKEVIDKWGQDTVRLFQTDAKPDTLVNRSLITALSVSSAYSTAIMTLLANELRLPAKALLRVIFELSAKLLWCLKVSDCDQARDEQCVEEKMARWAKDSLQNEKKLRTDLLMHVQPEIQATIRKQIDGLDLAINSLNTADGMPKFKKVLEQLGPSWDELFRVRLYADFNNTVHLDIVSLCSLVQDNGTKLTIGFDSAEPISHLAQCCAVIMHNIFWAIRTKYEWETQTMDEDFRQSNREA